MSWRKAAIGQYEKLVVDLLMYRGRVSLHLHRANDRIRAANRLLELPVNPALGARDLNFRLLREIQTAAQAEIDRQGRNVA